MMLLQRSIHRFKADAPTIRCVCSRYTKKKAEVSTDGVKGCSVCKSPNDTSAQYYVLLLSEGTFNSVDSLFVGFVAVTPMLGGVCLYDFVH